MPGRYWRPCSLRCWPGTSGWCSLTTYSPTTRLSCWWWWWLTQCLPGGRWCSVWNWMTSGWVYLVSNSIGCECYQLCLRECPKIQLWKELLMLLIKVFDMISYNGNQVKRFLLFSLCIWSVKKTSNNLFIQCKIYSFIVFCPVLI